MGFIRNLSVAFLVLSTLSISAYADDVLIFTKDSNGKMVQNLASTQMIKDSMVKTLSAVNDSVLKSVEEKEFKAGGWQLKMFSVGLGLTGKIGIGPWDFGSTIKQRVFFAR